MARAFCWWEVTEAWQTQHWQPATGYQLWLSSEPYEYAITLPPDHDDDGSDDKNIL